MNRIEVFQRLRTAKLIPLGCAQTEDASVSLVQASLAAGASAFELVLRFPGAEEQLAGVRRQAKAQFPDALIGVGSVVTVQQLESLDVRPDFVVMPGSVEAVLDYCAMLEIPVIPGAATVTELLAVWSRLATAESSCGRVDRPVDGQMVKIYPVTQLGGPAFVRALRAPLGAIGGIADGLVVSGGVRPDSLAEYFGAGAAGVSASAGDDFTPFIEALRSR